MTRSHLPLSACLLAASAAAVLPACRGDRSEKPPRRFLPDMDYQPKWQPQSGSDFYENGRAQQTPDPNAVAFGTTDIDPVASADQPWASSFLEDRAALLKEGDTFYLGTDPAGPEGWVATMPAEVTRDMLELGRDRFTIYCTPCHGSIGEGDGSVGQRWSYPPANLLGDLYKDRAQRQGTDGWLFNVTRNGVWGPDGSNKMPGYAHAIDEREAWAVVAYLRALQVSQSATIEDVPEARRSRLTSQGAAPATNTQPDTQSDSGGDS